MKIAALIVEYNPFHNGHLRQIKSVRKLVGASGAIIALMSGNFTQRGEISCLDKFTKAKLAVNLGVDLVLELPVQGVLSSADYFAETAISLIQALKFCDYIVCGAECEDVQLLQGIAHAFYLFQPFIGASLTDLENNTMQKYQLPTAATLPILRKQFQTDLQAALKSGINYAEANCNLLFSPTFWPYIAPLFPQRELEAGELQTAVRHALQQPNNILAIAYYKAALSADAGAALAEKIRILPRETGPDLQSAHALRQLITAAENSPHRLLNSLIDYLPPISLATLIKAAQKGTLMTCEKLQAALSSAVAAAGLLKDFPDSASLLPTADSYRKLSAILPDLIAQKGSFELAAKSLSHKGLTVANCRRKLLRQLLNLPEPDKVTLNRLCSNAQYLRVLAYSSYPGKLLLKQLSKSIDTPLIMRFSDLVQKQNYITGAADFAYQSSSDYRAGNYYALLSQNAAALEQNNFPPLIKRKSK